ncbi:MFS transporter [Aliifodinibius sp. S!AR15-10]|uniref:MFS transporter n=1 Tax=Aliifodinibius sp. S!AR15-10 TaxID=2950437 RepID=UPI00285D47F1|nr:MFS transporter [Aliifodinibius sp. S!AR15-10]MDR8393586.1 MFS transporter [Aliifodinibius sp. S!AR15-10]
MNRLLQFKLSALMFLEFFIWGAWYTTVAVFMTEHGMADLTHWPFTVNPIAAIVAPFFVGFIADRYFATEKVLGTLHILGALFMFLTPQATASPLIFILLLLAYNLCYMPTMSLANTICFHNIEDQEKQFPVIRVFGTIGWIVAGLGISFLLGSFVAENVRPEETALPLYLTSAASLLLGIYSFALPHTPPPAAGEKVSARSIIGIDALKQLGSKSFYVFLVSSLLISIPLAAYYNFTQLYLEGTGFQNIAATQTIGQMSEVLFMLLMPFFFIRLGVKWMLGVGMLAWVVRYGLFALGAPGSVTWMIIFGIALHGICYDFFFVTGQIYIDKKSNDNIRGQAQGLIILTTYGVGMFIGAQLAGEVFNLFLGSAEALTLQQWQQFWWIPALFAAAVLVLFLILFDDRVISKGEEVDPEEFRV